MDDIPKSPNEVIAEEYGISNPNSTVDDGKKERKTQVKKKKTHYIADFPELVDLVEEDGKVKFLTFNKEILSEVEIGGEILKPPPVVDWLLPNADKVLEDFSKHSGTSDTTDGNSGGCRYCQKELYPSMVNYFRQFSDPPSEYHYHYLALMAFHSYLIEKFNFSPILFLVATKDRGKTPTLKALAYVSRRGIFTETIREANLIRWGNDYKASLFFDVRDFPKRVEKSNSEDLIYGRAERGITSSRVLFPERGAFRDMVTFSTFGVTGATSNVMVDAITEARCIVFNMPFSKRIFDIEPLPELGLSLKEKLTAFRMAHIHTPFVNVKKEAIGKLESYLRGYHQMLKTLFPIHEKKFLSFKKATVRQKKQEAENTLEGRLLLAVNKLKHMVEEGTSVLLTEYITKEINEGRNERFHLSVERVGKELKGIGFEPRKNSSGTKRGIFYDEQLINSLKEQYGLGTDDIEEEGAPPSTPSDVSDPSAKDGEDIVSTTEKVFGVKRSQLTNEDKEFLARPENKDKLFVIKPAK